MLIYENGVFVLHGIYDVNNVQKLPRFHVIVTKFPGNVSYLFLYILVSVPKPLAHVTEYICQEPRCSVLTHPWLVVVFVRQLNIFHVLFPD